MRSIIVSTFRTSHKNYLPKVYLSSSLPRVDRYFDHIANTGDFVYS